MTNDKWKMMNGKSRAPVFVGRLAFTICLLLTFFSTTQAQEVVDKTVATVNGGVRTDLITYSDLLWQLALQPNTSLSQPSSETLNNALKLIEDQRLILQEAVKLPTIAPTEQEIQAARDELAKQFSSREELEKRMIKVGLTSEKLSEIMEQRVHIEKYLDFRFRSFIVVSQKDVAEYYRDAFVPRFKRRSPSLIVPTLEEARPEIEKILTEAKVESDIDSFLDNARDRAEIVILNPV
ncbi:MAG TPA: hypothetical protein VN643_19725 [Pyrinomonadaceae bacterium]|nr:hypothetical protein [Pyrinomonadaceae bacterium]